MPRRTTQLLVLLAIAGLIAAGGAYARMTKLRDDADLAARNSAATKAALAQIRQWRSSPGRAAVTVTGDTAQLSARLRDAAAAAGIVVPGSEPGNVLPVPNSDFSETPVYLSFEPLNLRQLTIFLHTMARLDPTSRAKAIELSQPQAGGAPAATATDVWTAGVEIRYLTYTPGRAR